MLDLGGQLVPLLMLGGSAYVDDLRLDVAYEATPSVRKRLLIRDTPSRCPWRRSATTSASSSATGSRRSRGSRKRNRSSVCVRRWVFSEWKRRAESGSLECHSVSGPIREGPELANRAFGEGMRELRTREGISQYGLAHASGI